MENLFNLLSSENLITFALVFVGVYEILVRRIPTIKDYTILGFLYRIFDFVAKNQSKGGIFKIKKL